MTKTAEEIKELKEEYETLNKKLKELTADELKQITGGSSTGGYKYSFRNKDYVYLDGTHLVIFDIHEDVDTNDDGYHVTGLRQNLGKPDFIDDFSSERADALLKCYKEIGGHLSALEQK